MDLEWLFSPDANNILLESASTDIIMSILHRYEIRYWNTKNIMKKKISSLRSYLIWLNNGDVGQTAALIKDIPREYYCLRGNGNNNIYLYSSLEKEFLQKRIFLRKYHVKYRVYEIDRDPPTSFE